MEQEDDDPRSDNSSNSQRSRLKIAVEISAICTAAASLLVAFTPVGESAYRWAFPAEGARPKASARAEPAARPDPLACPYPDAVCLWSSLDREPFVWRPREGRKAFSDYDPARIPGLTDHLAAFVANVDACFIDTAGDQTRDYHSVMQVHAVTKRTGFLDGYGMRADQIAPPEVCTGKSQKIHDLWPK
ncbi:hypothetical protein E1264_31800 [Actinomadura sp. KC216]|uniref:hypothetical protein n=1 Tax=Actinomadura sp. KC216 TaxID=2530370 RepID=UPI001050C31C|nr:hypothetical protein [Actinomadura sp. KC216]TDB82105.1 hypothetical protein E1264_31800 [Actinomadura sp. KC216]